MAFSATTIWIVVQFGLAIIRRGGLTASVGFTSGTNSGTLASIRKALELSIITASEFGDRLGELFRRAGSGRRQGEIHPFEIVVMLQEFDCQVFPAERHVRPAPAGNRTATVVDRQIAFFENLQEPLTHRSAAGAHDGYFHGSFRFYRFGSQTFRAKIVKIFKKQTRQPYSAQNKGTPPLRRQSKKASSSLSSDRRHPFRPHSRSGHQCRAHELVSRATPRRPSS